MNVIKRLAYTFIKFSYINKCKIHPGSKVHHCTFEGKNRIWRNASITYCDIGFGSYFGNGCKFYKAKIGRFCSISDDVILISATHPIDGFVSTSPAFYSVTNHNSLVNDQKFDEYIGNNDGVSLIVGSDVWIGNRVLIKAGIKIGNGAVIGMGAVVTKDIPDYAIVAGVPAKVIGYRHSEDIRRKLIESHWWDKNLDWIKDNADSFTDVHTFLQII